MASQDELSALLVTIQVSIDKAVKNLNKIKGKMEEVAGVSTKTTDKMVDNDKKKETSTQKWMSKNSYALRTAGRALVVYGGIVTAIFGKSMAELLKYQMALADVSTMVQAQGGQFVSLMNEFDQTIRSLSVEYNQSTEDLAKGLYNILSACFEASDALEILKWSAISAVGGITETGIAADALTTVLNSYSLGAKDAGDVSDWLWGIVRRGKITYEQLARSIGKVSAIAANAGLSMNELGAALMTATRAGVRHRIATTSMNSVIMAFLKPQEKSIRLAKEFGITLDVNTLKTEGLVGVVKKLTGANRYNNVATADQIAQIFNNRRALRIIMPIINQYAGFLKDVAYLTDRHGFALSAFNKIAGQTQYKIEALGKALKLLRMEAVAPFEAMLASLVEELSSIIQAIRDLPTWIKTAAVAFIAMTAAISLVIGALLLLAPGIILVGTLLSGPTLAAIGIIIASIIGGGGLVAALASLSLVQDESIKKMTKWSASIKKIRSDHKNLIITLSGLIKKYEDYLVIVDKTAEGTKERAAAEADLVGVVQSIAVHVPQAITSWDKYGKALRADIPTVKEMIRLQEELYISTIKNEMEKLRVIVASAKARATAIAEEKKDIQDRLKAIRASIDEERALLKSIDEDFGGTMHIGFGLDIKEEDVEEKISTLNAEFLGLTDTMRALNDETTAAGIATIQLAVFLKEMTEAGRITEYELYAITNAFPLVGEALKDLTSGEIKETTKAFGELGGSLEEIKKKFGSFENFMNELGKDRPGWEWKHDLLDLEVALEQAEFAMKDLYDQPALDKDQKKEFKDLRKEIQKLKGDIKSLKAEGSAADATAFAAAKTLFKKEMEFWAAKEKANTQVTIDEMKKRVAAMEEGSMERIAAEEVVTEFTEKAVKDRTKEITKEIKDYIKLTGVGTQGVIAELRRRQSSHIKFGVEWMAYDKKIADYMINLAGEVSAAWSNMFSGLNDGIEDLMSAFMTGEATTFDDVSKQTAEIQKEIDEIRDSLANASKEEVDAGLEKIGELEDDIRDLETVFDELGDSFLDTLSTGFSDLISEGLGIEELLSTTGGFIGAAVFTLAEMGAEGVGNVMDQITSTLEQLPEYITKLLAEIPKIITVLMEKIPEILDALVTAIPLILQAIVDAIPVIIDALVEAIPVIVKSLLEAIPLIIASIIEAIPTIIEAILNGILDILVMVVQMIPMIITELIEMLPLIINAVIEMIPKLIETFIGMIPVIIQEVIDAIPVLIQSIIEAIPAIIEALIKLLPMVLMGIWGPMGAMIGKAVVENLSGVFDAIADVVSDIGDAISDLFSSVGDIFEGIGEVISEFLSDVIEGIGEFFGELFSNIIEAIGEFFQKVLSFVVDFFLKIIEQEIAFITKAVQQIGEFITKAISAITNLISKIISAIVSFFSDAFKAIGDFFIDSLKEVVTFFLDIHKDIAQFFLDLLSDLADFFIDAINAIFDALGEVVEDAGSDIGDTLDFTDSWQEGTRWTGEGKSNEIAGVVHKKEAVIPWSALKRGAAGVMDFMGYDLSDLVTGNTKTTPGDTSANLIPELPSLVPLSGLNIPNISIPNLAPVPTVFEQNISMHIPSGGIIPPRSEGNIDINQVFQIEGGIIDDPIYWENVVRGKVMPAMDSALARRGLKLGN